MPFEREVWWVKTARGWFSSNNGSSYKGYLRIAASALILELWYRFVWAGHTYRVYRDIQHRRKEASHTRDKQDTDQPEESLEAMVEEKEDTKDEYDTEDVVEPQNVSHDDEDDDEEDEEDERGSGGRPAEEIDLVPSRRRTGNRGTVSPRRAEKGDPMLPSEDSASDSDTDEAEEVLPSETASGDGPMDVIPSVVSVFIAQPTIVRALDAAESRYFERLEASERMLASAVPSAPTFSPFGTSDMLADGHSAAQVETPEAQFVRCFSPCDMACYRPSSPAVLVSPT
jgi:hypothetical protein